MPLYGWSLLYSQRPSSWRLTTSQSTHGDFYLVKQIVIALLAMLGGFMALKLPFWESVAAIAVIILIIYKLGQP